MQQIVDRRQKQGDELELRNLAQRVRELRDRVIQEVGRVVVGMEPVTHQFMIALLAGGHVLLEGVPGVAKTTLSKAFARVLGTQYQRIQFTPDLLPADVTGTYIFDRKANDFVLRRGPIFCQVLLADEVNRAPAKTQSALLEAMQEVQVTIEGTTLQLPQPFMVLATQNPVEHEGVYRLPEAQLDRFLLRVEMGYPAPRVKWRCCGCTACRSASRPSCCRPRRSLKFRRKWRTSMAMIRCWNTLSIWPRRAADIPTWRWEPVRGQPFVFCAVPVPVPCWMAGTISLMKTFTPSPPAF